MIEFCEDKCERTELRRKLAKTVRAGRQLAAVAYAVEKEMGMRLPRALSLRLMRAINRARDARLI